MSGAKTAHVAEYKKEIPFDKKNIMQGKGCAKCNQIGYKGRMTIIEIMAVNSKMRELMGKKASYQELRRAAIESGMETLFQNGIRKAEKGLTSLEEVLSKTLGME